MLGRLTWSAIPFDEPLPLLSGAVVGVVILAILVTVTVKGWWPYLWREWLTSVDHKRIGVMYLALGLVMLLRGFSDAIMMRAQQAIAVGSAQGYLPPQHYDQVFSAHGTIMIFFVAMPLVIGLMNFAVPLQLGVRDVAFPVLNSVSFWLTASGVLLINASLVIGNFARTGWMGYPPLSELAFSPDEGVDYYLWSLQISGIGTLLTGVNFVTTILKLRAPGMTYFRMPVFCWTALAANLLIVAAFPILTATFVMLLLDRYLGMHFFTNDAGGNQMMYVNLFWAWGHPEVYILILPVFGIFSEDLVKLWASDPRAPYENLGRPTLINRANGGKRGYTLDFTLRDRRKSDEVFVAELKCEIEYQSFKYFVLTRNDQLDHHKKPAFEAFLQTARSPNDWKVTIKGREISTKGAILIWGDATPCGKQQVKGNKGFHEVLTVADICRDLRQWKCERFEGLLAERQRWCEEMFSGLLNQVEQKISLRLEEGV